MERWRPKGKGLRKGDNGDGDWGRWMKTGVWGAGGSARGFLPEDLSSSNGSLWRRCIDFRERRFGFSFLLTLITVFFPFPLLPSRRIGTGIFYVKNVIFFNASIFTYQMRLNGRYFWTCILYFLNIGSENDKKANRWT